jgi:lipoprotein-anchoring transpeptidase ErfK/SrfK
VSGFRRSMPYLAGGSALVAVAVAAALAIGASTAPRSNAIDTAAARSISARVPAVQERSMASLESSAAKARAVTAMELASARAAAAKSAAIEAASARTMASSETSRLRAEGVPCDIYAAACVSLSKQEAWLMRDGRVVYGPVRVATGRAGLPTPAGNFHVWYKVVDGWSSIYDSPMPYSVFFYGGDAFHEDPVTVRSHGCVHLSLGNAEYFYHFLNYGALVEVRY